MVLFLVEDGTERDGRQVPTTEEASSLDQDLASGEPHNFPSGLGSNALHAEKSRSFGDFHVQQITYGRWVI
jgi:hypothetical protein